MKIGSQPLRTSARILMVEDNRHGLAARRAILESHGYTVVAKQCPKAALGCKPQPFGILVRHRQPVLNKMMKSLLLGIEHDEAPERSPFKKVAEKPVKAATAVAAAVDQAA